MLYKPIRTLDICECTVLLQGHCCWHLIRSSASSVLYVYIYLLKLDVVIALACQEIIFK